MEERTLLPTRWLKHMTWAFCLAATSIASGAVIPIYGTGFDSAGNLLADGAVDGNYLLTASSDASTPGPAAYVSRQDRFPIVSGPWVPDTSTSKWISPNPDPSLNLSPGNYTFTYTFDLTGFLPGTVTISGQFAADDGSTVSLNGAQLVPLSGGYSSYTPFLANSGFVAGLNTLTFNVANQGGPTGLKVDILEATGTADTSAAVPEPSVIYLVVGGVLLAAGLRRRIAA